jgi:hypothetical protein
MLAAWRRQRAPIESERLVSCCRAIGVEARPLLRPHLRNPAGVIQDGPACRLFNAPPSRYWQHNLNLKAPDISAAAAGRLGCTGGPGTGSTSRGPAVITAGRAQRDVHAGYHANRGAVAAPMPGLAGAWRGASLILGPPAGACGPGRLGPSSSRRRRGGRARARARAGLGVLNFQAAFCATGRCRGFCRGHCRGHSVPVALALPA